MARNICFNPPVGSTTLLLGLNIVCLIISLFGVILTQYKSQFYVDSEVTRALYYGSSIFCWAVFLLSAAHICFAMMQRKHLHRVSADYPEIDLRTGKKGQYLAAVLVLSWLAAAGGFGFGGFGVYYMQTAIVKAIEFDVNDTSISLAGDGVDSSLSVLELSVVQTLEGDANTWKNVQDRLGCCSWANVTDEYATGYCCNNRDKSCPLAGAVACREPWLNEMWTLNLQVCILLLATGLLHILSAIALVQLRFCARSSLFMYSAYGASVKEKQKKERAMSLAVTQATLQTLALAAAAEAADDPTSPHFQKQEGNTEANSPEMDEKDAEEAEKEPLTGAEPKSSAQEL